MYVAYISGRPVRAKQLTKTVSSVYIQLTNNHQHANSFINKNLNEKLNKKYACVPPLCRALIRLASKTLL